jgi:multiple antibiotic resistance protein
MEPLVVLKALVLVPMTLLPIMNPLSTAPVSYAATAGSLRLAKRLARRVQIAWTGWAELNGIAH